MATQESISEINEKDKNKFSPLCVDTFAICHSFEKAEINSRDLGDLRRAGSAISAIARLIQNAANEVDFDEGHQLSPLILGGLYSAIEIIGGNVSGIAENVIDRANKEMNHDH